MSSTDTAGTVSLHGMSATLRENIHTLRDRRERELREAPRPERVAAAITRFTGSLAFVYIHLVLYGVWIAINLGIVPGAPKFDPSFFLLGMEASVEAIFLSTFVLISQNRMAIAADRRADLDLHVSLLAEHELTQLAHLVARIAERLAVDDHGEDFQEIRKNVDPEQILDVLEAQAAEP